MVQLPADAAVLVSKQASASAKKLVRAPAKGYRMSSSAAV